MENWLEQITEASVLELMAPSVRQFVEKAFREDAEIDQIGAVLAAEPALGLAPKGGTAWPDFWRNIQVEIRILVCTDDPKYEKLRKGLQTNGALAGGAIIDQIATALAPHLGSNPGVILPVLGLALLGVAKVGHAAWCKTVSGTPNGQGQ